MIELRGSTWDHSRGYDPLPATAVAFNALHPDVRITWERRTLQDFGEMSVVDLAGRYDLIVLDHPWLGATHAANALLPLDQYVDAAVLDEQAQNSVGKSHASYDYEGHLWAFAVDAAAQTSAYRPDLLDAEPPATWDAVLALARRLNAAGRTSVSVPLCHIDTLPCFVTLCANAGEAPFTGSDGAVSRAVGRYALEMLRELLALGHPDAIGWNPPAILDRMSSTDEVAYVPLLFCYSNYSRPGYRPHLVQFTNIPADAHGRPRGAILGGAGMAVSASTQHPEIASAYAAFSASPEIQRTLYFENGGQPGHRAAWTDATVNAACNNFFLNVLPTMDESTLRPRYNGWIGVQDATCALLHRFLKDGGDIDATLNELDAVYLESLE
jgi:multiple sugar transport system substrate-binding protein